MPVDASLEPTPIDDAPVPAVFDRVVVGVDGSEPGFEAVRQARRLVAADGRLEVFTAVHLVEATLAGWSAPRMGAELEREAREAIRRAKEIAGSDVESRLVDGPPLKSLIHELIENDATLAVVGSHGHSRSSEIMIGGVAGELLHNAPCSVLIARAPPTDAVFPRAVVAGADGSPESKCAVSVARDLSYRFAVPLRVVTALKGTSIDLARAERTGPIETLDEHPVPALVHASATADILVVGSRGLKGLRALGSVSERVAHQAGCSVLVVRSPGRLRAA